MAYGHTSGKKPQKINSLGPLTIKQWLRRGSNSRPLAWRSARCTTRPQSQLNSDGKKKYINTLYSVACSHWWTKRYSFSSITIVWPLATDRIVALTNSFLCDPGPQIKLPLRPKVQIVAVGHWKICGLKPLGPRATNTFDGLRPHW